MKHLVLLLGLSTGFSFCATAQVDAQDFLTQILLDTTRITAIHVPVSRRLVHIKAGPGNPMQTLIKTKRGLYTLIDGTGRVYELKAREGAMTITRIDSTFFTGYNFGAFSFSYRDTLYSFGGYGFWHYNGQLRAYIAGRHEWELIELDKEVPIEVANPSAVCAWFDQAAGDLYVMRMPVKTLQPDSVYTLNLKTKEWRTLGLNLLPTTFLQYIQTPMGVLARASDSNRDSFYLIAFKNNGVLEMNTDKAQEIKSAEGPHTLAYSTDSALVLFGNAFHVIPLGLDDFHPTGQRVFEPITTGFFAAMMKGMIGYMPYVSAGVLFSFILGYVLGKRRAINRGHQVRMTPANGAQKSIFDEREKALIELIFGNSSKSQSTSIDDINKLLGLTAKAVEVQKKHRSDVTISINKKFQYIINDEKPLLKRIRSDVDKRTFEFYIEFEDYSRLNGLL